MFALFIFEFFFILFICFIIINSIYLSVSFSNLMSFLGFCFPENYFLFDVILLYVEIFNIGLIILITLLNTLSILLSFFRFKSSDDFSFVFSSSADEDISTIEYIKIINQHNFTSLEFDPQTEEFFDFIFVLIPSIFILMILIPCVGYLYTSEFFFNWLLYDVKLDLIGYQWYWYYEFKIESLYSSSIYENNGYITKYCDFVTVFNQEEDNFKRNLDLDSTMVVPQNINVLISISSGDVIHSWTIPGYTTKFDAIPGRTYCFINVISEVGYNWGQCSELCGANHAFMPSSLDVQTERYSYSTLSVSTKW